MVRPSERSEGRYRVRRDGLALLLLVVLFVWLSHGLFAGWLAQEKGRRFGAWFTLALVFGPLAILTVGLSPRGYVGFKPCLECQEPINLAATKCPFCTTDLIQAETRKMLASPLSSD